MCRRERCWARMSATDVLVLQLSSHHFAVLCFKNLFHSVAQIWMLSGLVLSTGEQQNQIAFDTQ